MKRSQKRNKKSKSKKKQTKKDNGSFKYPITDYISTTNTNSKLFPIKYPIFDNYYKHYSNKEDIYYDYSKKQYPIFDNYYSYFSNLHNKYSYNSSYAGCCSQYNDDFDNF
jgi:hypothetical protein